MVTTKLRPYRQLELLVLFALVLGVSLLVFAVFNQRAHQRTAAQDYAACIKDRQIAANQRRVILAVLTLAHEKKTTDQQTIQEVRKALINVPQFNCKR